MKESSLTKVESIKVLTELSHTLEKYGFSLGAQYFLDYLKDDFSTHESVELMEAILEALNNSGVVSCHK